MPAKTLLSQAERYIQREQHLPAAETYAKFLKAYPRHPSSRSVALRYGQLLMKAGRYQKAIEHFRRLTRREPEHTEAMFNLAQAQAFAARFDEATATLNRLLEIDPRHPRGLARRAVFLQYAGEIDEAVSVLDDAQRRGVRHWSIELAFAGIASRVGRDDEAIARIEKMLDEDELDREAHTGLLFNLGYLLDRAGRYDEAWEAVSEGNALIDARIDPATFDERVARAIETIDAEAIRSLPEPVDPGKDVVLVLGSPRSGTTLIEQILAAHPEAETAGELYALRSAAAEITTGPDDLVWAPGRVRKADVIKASGAFLGDLRGRLGRVRRKIDKTPHNWQLLGPACRLLPGARVVYCDRDPRDIAVSCYFRMFSSGHEYTTRLDWIGRYLVSMNRLMRHWERVIPEAVGDFRMTRARYERVVADAEEEARRLVAFAGLEWDEACLAFHTRRQAPATLNNDQVGRRVYDRSVARWRNYEKRLGPLLEAMGDEAPTG